MVQVEKGLFSVAWEPFLVGTQSVASGQVLTKAFLSGTGQLKPETGDPGGGRLTRKTSPLFRQSGGEQREVIAVFQSESQA